MSGARSTLAERAGVDDDRRREAVRAVLDAVRAAGLEFVRVAWGDLHGTFRGKSLVVGEDVSALTTAFDEGLGFVSTILMKDTSDRTAFRVFDPAAPEALPGLRGARNLLLLPDPASFVRLPWAPHIGWLRAEVVFADGSPVALDPRRVLQRALQSLADRGFGLRCGLEVEFHVHRIVDDSLAVEASAWPAEPPAVRLLHAGYNLLTEACADQSDEALGIVRRTALGLGLPLRTLEIELGPSQFEAVFGVTDALAAADQMLLFRNGTRQALRRAGYHASFVCRPPLPQAVASGWHLHHSLVDARGDNAFRREAPAGPPDTATQVLSATGVQWLAGLLDHARGMAALCAPTLPAYARYQGSVMAPQAALWGRDNRGAMMRVVGEPGDPATRIENRLGEPMANPYLCIAAQALAGLDGLARQLDPGPETSTPYAAAGAARLPTSLGEALDALAADAVLQHGLGLPMARLFDTVKRQELARAAEAADADQWLRREYFGRY